MKNSTRLKNGAVQAVLLRQKMGEKLEKIAQNHQPHNKITLEKILSEKFLLIYTEFSKSN